MNKFQRSRLRLISFLASSLALLLLIQTLPASAATTVRVQTALGAFDVELFEDLAPEAVAQFLANVESGAYHFTAIHQGIGGEVKGGLFTYNSCQEGLRFAVPDFTFPAAESGIPNSVGTLALIRDPSDPSMLTNEWFISLASNTVDESSPLAPVVIGEVSAGLDLVNFIHGSWRVNLGFGPVVPTLNYAGLFATCSVFSENNIFRVAMSVLSVDPPASTTNSFDPNTGLLSVNLDAGPSGLLRVSLALLETAPDVVVRVLPETLVPLSAPTSAMATFDAAAGTVSVPEIRLAGEVALTSVVFELTDFANLVFTLRSFEEPETE